MPARLAIGLAFVLALTSAAFGIGIDGFDTGGTAAAVPPGIDVQVSGSAAGAPVAPGFIGLSTEYTSVLPYLGRNPAAPNPTFLALVRALAPGARPVLRIGGDSTDWTWWPVPGVRRPGGVSYSITQRWLAVTRAAATALDAQLILGINLEADSRRIAGAEARALVDGLGRGLVAGFELGNEPELYGAFGWYTNAAGVSVKGRPATYQVAAYVHDFQRISSSLPADVPLAGPASGTQPWVTAASRSLAGDPRVTTVTDHAYPLHGCYTPATSPQYPTVANLLDPQAASSPAASVQDAIAAAHAHGLQFRLDELNSVSCMGKAGVSNTFASALWAVGALFKLAAAGADGVNIHTFAGSTYEPFSFIRRDHRWLARVAPLYYGLLMFARAAPAGARLLPASVVAATDGIGSDPTSGLDTYATRAGDGTVRVVLINDSNRQLPVVIRQPLARPVATLERLLAPSPTATSGVTLAGQSFGRWSATGALGGNARITAIHAIGGAFALQMPPASAALLTVPN